MCTFFINLLIFFNPVEPTYRAVSADWHAVIRIAYMPPRRRRYVTKRQYARKRADIKLVWQARAYLVLVHIDLESKDKKYTNKVTALPTCILLFNIMMSITQFDRNCSIHS